MCGDSPSGTRIFFALDWSTGEQILSLAGVCVTCKVPAILMLNVRRLGFVSLAISIALVSACGVDSGGSPGNGDGAGLRSGDASSMPQNDSATNSDTAANANENDRDANTGDPSDGNGGDAGDTGPLSPTYKDYSINHVLVTGQSNSVANGATPPLTTTPPPGFSNYMFDTGVMSMTSCDGNGCRALKNPTSIVPLVESSNFFGYKVETPSAGFAYEISNLAKRVFDFGVRPEYPAKHDVLVSVHGRSGNTYWCLRKGYCSYNEGRGHESPFNQAMTEVTKAKALASALGRSYVVRAVAVVHGESDHYSYVANKQEFPLDGTDGTRGKIRDYSDGLIEWQEDYESSIKAITGQTEPVLLLISGISGWTDTRESPIAKMQLDAHVRAPGKVLYVTPGYPLPAATDCLHYTNHGERQLGEYFAKVYARVVFGGQRWEPVRLKSISRVGRVVTVDYHVPNPPLVLDTEAVSQIQDYGFDFWDNGGRSNISSVAVTGPTKVTITLGAVPSGANMRLKYAQNEPKPGCIGPGHIPQGGGARGNLRDSDDTPSQFGYKLWNWGAHFDLAVD
jgi:hypothetical protein